jgi:hypothetical protein
MLAWHGRVVAKPLEKLRGNIRQSCNLAIKLSRLLAVREMFSPLRKQPRLYVLVENITLVACIRRLVLLFAERFEANL